MADNQDLLMPIPYSGCIIWMGLMFNGYGKTMRAGRHVFLNPRFSASPPGLDVAVLDFLLAPFDSDFALPKADICFPLLALEVRLPGSFRWHPSPPLNHYSRI